MSRHPSIRRDTVAKPDNIEVQCDHCKSKAKYHPTAFHAVRIETTSYLIGYRCEFFCLGCKELSRFGIDEALYATLVDLGVTSTVVVAPDEVAEINARSTHQALTHVEVQALLTELNAASPDALLTEATVGTKDG